KIDGIGYCSPGISPWTRRYIQGIL
ncbi:MAG: hypothetical protein IH946_11510, partial [Bacteroidetes bacterium]|nr:hypothetical protein [Bacteroidota bacterium]